jgi:hypothetical protein
MTYATGADVQAVAGRELDTAETAIVKRRLAQVHWMIPDLAAKTADGDPDQDDVRDIEAEAIYRVVSNADCIRSENDGQYGYTLSAEAADDRLRVTADEWAVLGVRIGKICSITANLGLIR